jgi:hypothetical protein
MDLVQLDELNVALRCAHDVDQIVL